MNLASAFADSARKNPGKTALFWGDRAYSYAELEDQALFVADLLQRHFRVSPGDRVALWLKNCPEFVPALLGILHAGAAAVPINNFLKPDEVNYVLHDAGIDVIIADGELSAHYQTLKAERPALKLLDSHRFYSHAPLAIQTRFSCRYWMRPWKPTR